MTVAVIAPESDDRDGRATVLDSAGNGMLGSKEAVAQLEVVLGWF